MRWVLGQFKIQGDVIHPNPQVVVRGYVLDPLSPLVHTSRPSRKPSLNSAALRKPIKSSSLSIPQWFTRVQHVRDALSRTLGTAQLQKDLAFQIEQVALSYFPMRPTTSCKHPSQTAPYDHVVLAELLQQPVPRLCARVKAPALRLQ